MKYLLQRLNLTLTLIFAFAIVFVANSALAQSQAEIDAYKRLLNYEYRPTVSDFLAEFGYRIPSAKLFNSFRAPTIASAGPKMIASLEYVYPNGTYAALGRDAFLLADIVNAFFLHYGVSGRGVYLHASTATVADLLKTDGKALQFLFSNSFDPNKSFVIMDRTSMRSQSQSTCLYRVMVNYLKDQGRSREDIGKKLGVATTLKATKARDFGGMTAASRVGHPLGLGNISNIGRLTDIGFWTDTYGPAEKISEDQPMRGRISRRLSHKSRDQVLDLIYDAVVTASQPEFLDKVKEYAAKLGYDFDSRLSPEGIAVAIADHQRAATELAAKVAREKEIDEVTNRIFANLNAKYLLPKHLQIQDIDKKSASSIDIRIIKSICLKSIGAYVSKLADSLADKFMPIDSDVYADDYISNLKNSFVGKIETASGNLSTGKDLSGLPFFLALLPKPSPQDKPGKFVSNNGEYIYRFLCARFDEFTIPAIFTDEVIEALFTAKNENLIDERDLRRLFGWVIAKSYSGSIDLTDVVSKNARLKDFLIENGNRYTTSSRYEGDGRKGYRKLVAAGVLRKVSLLVKCRAFLHRQLKERDFSDYD